MNDDPFAGSLGISAGEITDAFAVVVAALMFAPLVGLAMVFLVESLVPRKGHR